MNYPPSCNSYPTDETLQDSHSYIAIAIPNVHSLIPLARTHHVMVTESNDPDFRRVALEVVSSTQIAPSPGLLLCGTDYLEDAYLTTTIIIFLNPVSTHRTPTCPHKLISTAFHHHYNNLIQASLTLNSYWNLYWVDLFNDWNLFYLYLGVFSLILFFSNSFEKFGHRHFLNRYNLA